MSDQDVYDAEWNHSRLRAEWEQPGIEEWDDMGVDLEADTSPECVASYEDDVG